MLKIVNKGVVPNNLYRRSAHTTMYGTKEPGRYALWSVYTAFLWEVRHTKASVLPGLPAKIEQPIIRVYIPRMLYYNKA